MKHNVSIFLLIIYLFLFPAIHDVRLLGPTGYSSGIAHLHLAGPENGEVFNVQIWLKAYETVLLKNIPLYKVQKSKPILGV